MAPRVSKKNKDDLPNPVVQTGALGVYPLMNLSLSYLYGDYADAVLGVKDEPVTLSLKGKQQISVMAGKKKAVPFNVKGKFFNGLSDSFYRGKLPNVIICVMEVAYLEHFVEEFLNHIEKMLSLGFFLKKVNPVEELVPCFVIASNGIFFNNLLNKLCSALEKFNGVDERILQQIMAKFTRGTLDFYHEQSYLTGNVVELEKPCLIRLAGGAGQTQMMVQSVLSAHGLVVAVENKSQNPVERLELLNAYKRIVFSVLPLLLEKKKILKKEFKPMEKTVQEAVLEIGVNRKSFEANESAKVLVDSADNSKDKGSVISGDLSILTALESMAAHYDMASAESLFKTIKENVNELVRSEAAV